MNSVSGGWWEDIIWRRDLQPSHEGPAKYHIHHFKPVLENLRHWQADEMLKLGLIEDAAQLPKLGPILQPNMDKNKSTAKEWRVNCEVDSCDETVSLVKFMADLSLAINHYGFL